MPQAQILMAFLHVSLFAPMGGHLLLLLLLYLFVVTAAVSTVRK